MSHTIDLLFTTGIKFWFKTNILDPHHRHHNHSHQHDNQVPSCNRANLLLVLLHRIHGSSKMVGIDNYFNLDYLINTLCLILGSWWWTLWFTASCTPTMLSGPWGCPLQPQYWFCLLLYMTLLFISWAWFLCEGIDHQRQWPCWLHHCRFQIKTKRYTFSWIWNIQ